MMTFSPPFKPKPNEMMDCDRSRIDNIVRQRDIILVNDNLESHAFQRGVHRVFYNTTQALVDHFGSSVLICSSTLYPDLKGKQYLVPRIPGRLANYFYRRYPIHATMVSIVSAFERPRVIYNPFYNPLRTQIPQIYTVYDMIFERFPNYFSSRIARRHIKQKLHCFKTGALLLAISENTARDILRFYPEINPEKIIIIHLGVESVFFESPEPLVSSRPYFLFAGRRSLYKNFLSLVHAYARSGLAEDYDLRVFSPDGPCFEPEEQKLIAHYGLEKHILLAHSPNDRQVRDLYAGATALIYPSVYEGFGLPVLEAMASGTIVAASNTSSLPEIGGDVALYFDPYNIDDLAQVMMRITTLSEHARRELIDRGRRHSRKYTWERFRMRTVEVFRRFLQAE